MIPDHPIRNVQELKIQSRWLNRRLGALRPYLLRFKENWVMVTPAIGVTWNALDAAVGLNDTVAIKGPSLQNTISALDQIIGELQGMDSEDNIPKNPSQPIRPGVDIDYIISGYLKNLHPYIFKGCSQLFLDGYYIQAVEESAKAVLEYIRQKTGSRLDGMALINFAFSTAHPMLSFGDLSDENIRNEQIGFMDMLKGFAKGVRNPLTHTHGRKEEMQKAFEYLVMASLFCRRIDDSTLSAKNDNN